MISKKIDMIKSIEKLLDKAKKNKNGNIEMYYYIKSYKDNDSNHLSRYHNEGKVVIDQVHKKSVAKTTDIINSLVKAFRCKGYNVSEEYNEDEKYILIIFTDKARDIINVEIDDIWKDDNYITPESEFVKEYLYSAYIWVE